MAEYDYDLFVIGAGSGGVRAARVAALHGARVAVAEADRVGGTCVIRGCVPKKFMVYASEFAHHFKEAAGYGWTVPEPSFDWNGFRQQRDMEVARLSGIYVKNLRNAGAELLHGHASFVDGHTIRIEGEDARTVTAGKILIATGGKPTRPQLEGAEHALVSDDIFDLPELPRSMLVVGGGYIGLEFASIFNGLGVDVTVAYRGSNILKSFDEDVRAHLAEELEKRGVKVMLSCVHDRIEKRGEALVSHLSRNQACETDVILFAIGRDPATEGLNLEAAGVETGPRGEIKVDNRSRSSAPHIFAVGDVTDRINLTPVAIREGHAFADSEFGGKDVGFDHEAVASAVFTQPPVGAVGLTEAEARQGNHGPVDVYLTRFRAMKSTFRNADERVLMKLVVRRRDDRVLGCHIVGPDSPEMIQFAAIAVKAGLTKAQWDATCAVHPTVAEEMVTLREPYVAPGLQAAE